MKIKRLRQLFVGTWEPITIILTTAIVLTGLMLYRLGTLVPYLSRSELSVYHSSQTLRLVADKPINLPYKLSVYVLNQIIRPNSLSLRLVSVTIATVTALLFMYIVSRWYSRVVAILGTLLFVCSAWFLHYARLATPDITLTLLIASLAYGYWIRKTRRSALVGIIGIVIAAGLVYVPGMVWFILIGGLWQSRQIVTHLKESKLTIPVLVILAGVLLAPLVIGIVKHPDLIKQLVGLPANGFPNASDYVKQTLAVPVQLFLRGPYAPDVWLGRMPLLDIFTTTMTVLGVYAYFHRRQLDRAKLVFAVLLLGSLLIGLHGGVSTIILAPFIYILAIAGMSYLLNEWFAVYPRNPLARIVGISLICLAVFLACFYNLRHYFVAWPNAPVTKQTFNHQI